MIKDRLEYDKKVIGENLREFRIAKKLTIEEVREYLQIGSQQAIYKWEEGRCYPQADNLLALMQLYEVGLEELVYRKGEYPMLTLTAFLRQILPAGDYMVCWGNLILIICVVKFRFWKFYARIKEYRFGD